MRKIIVILVLVSFITCAFAQNSILNVIKAFDQDLMNVLCRNRIKWIKSCWNTFPFLEEEFENTIRLIPDEQKEYWIDGYDNPGFIHYTIPVKPWLETKGVYSYASRYFWYYATRTPGINFRNYVDKTRSYEKRKLFMHSIIHNQYEDFYDDITGRNLYVYGYGYRGNEIVANKDFADKIVAFIDADEHKWQNDEVKVCGTDCINKDSVILISNDCWEEIAIYLSNLGVEKIY